MIGNGHFSWVLGNGTTIQLPGGWSYIPFVGLVAASVSPTPPKLLARMSIA
ncbi:hypothetical protein JVT61DRAFT_8844 [Boletus reticuloceps]|uniref:Uncharacterized protein n=1 Tax=Boletus reticuloceps TaxID=495285 RepID=A0A8I2YHG2_9AGAM|nr:hypothetical protein JVT61DRAFT_8844 [Boletus reticuloceps]